jgi:hypothetical protein
MAKIADLPVKGLSGATYTFEVYPISSNWAEVGAVYLVTKRVQKPDGGGNHTYIYVGQTENLKTRHSSHHKAECFVQHGANCLCVIVKPGEQERLNIEKDILKSGQSFPCND